MTDDKDDDKKSGGKNQTSTINKGLNVDLSGSSLSVIDGEATESITEMGKNLIDKLANGTNKVSEMISVKFPSLASEKISHAKENATVKKIEQKSIENDMKHELKLARMKNRIFEQESMYQENLENVGTEAAKNLKEDAEPEKIPEDWFQKFSQEARIIGDEDIQKIWAWLLAGNANSKGSFSKNVISILASMDRQDAEDFTNVCSCVIQLNDKNNLFINDLNEHIYINNEITFEKLLHLCELRLLTTTSGSFVISYNASENTEVRMLCSYFDTKFLMLLKNNALQVGNFSLTKAGEELFKICKPKKTHGFLEHVQKKFKKQGHVIE